MITYIWSLAQHYPHLAQPGPNHWATIFCINIHFITIYCIFIYVIILYIVFLLYIIYPGPMAQTKNVPYIEKIKNKKLFFFYFFSLYRRTVFPLKSWAIGPAVPQTRHLRAFPASSSPGPGPNLGSAGPGFCSAGPKKSALVWSTKALHLYFLSKSGRSSCCGSLNFMTRSRVPLSSSLSVMLLLYE